MYGLIGTITIGEWGAPGWALFIRNDLIESHEMTTSILS